MSLWLAILLAASPAPDAGPGFAWELPLKVVADVPIEGTTWVEGVPVRLRQLVVEGSPIDIGRHFVDSFNKQQLYMAPRQQIEHLLTGVDPDTLVTYSVVIRSTQGKLTTVVLGEAHPLERQKKDNALPVMPGASAALPVQFEGYQLLSYEVDAPEPKILEFYAAELTAAGYRQAEPGQWLRATDRVEVTVQPGPRKKVVVRRTVAAPQGDGRELPDPGHR